MKVVILDVLSSRCDLTGKENVECLKVHFDDFATEVVCVPAELVKLLRLRKKQESGDKAAERKGVQP